MNPIRVLLLEDDEKLAGILVRGLADDGLSVDVAVTGAQALAMAGRTDYDAMILDVMLPGMDGLEACRRLRRGGLSVPVLVISARDDLSERDLRGAGADQFMAKPLRVAELGERVRRPRIDPAWAAPTSADPAGFRGPASDIGWWARIVRSRRGPTSH